MLGLQYDWETPCCQAKFISISYSQCCLKGCKVEEKVKITGNYPPPPKKKNYVSNYLRANVSLAFCCVLKSLFCAAGVWTLLELCQELVLFLAEVRKTPSWCWRQLYCLLSITKDPLFGKENCVSGMKSLTLKTHTQTKNKRGCFALFKTEADRGSGTGDDLADNQNISHS